MSTDDIQKLAAVLMALIALTVLAYMALTTNSETAMGALISVVSAATGYFMRGKVQTP